MLSDSAYQGWVASLADDIVGFATGHLLYPIDSDGPGAQLIGLVSAEHARGRGVGSGLCAHFEQWAAAAGATRAILGSALHRTEAHGFYERRGYVANGLRFGKELPREPGGDLARA
ncbi:MAG TPA: GNAT family N-acetyltransferase [Mycobacteriales bacterium]|nr:GNAT family N-acetyltransferase [Mycobacteriales bacterium]